MKSSRRSAFTLTELLVVIGILLILSVLAFAVFGTGKSSDKMRSGARTAQAGFLGAKDRAMHAKDLRGLRFTRDLTNLNLVNGMVYVKRVSVDENNPGVLPYPAGSFQMERLSTVNPPAPDAADVFVLRGFDGTESNNPPPLIPYVDWAQKQQFFATPGQIRIPSVTGQWYSFYTTTTGPYALGTGNECLILQTAYPGTAPVSYQSGNPATTIAFPRLPANQYGSCDIQLGNDVLPFHQPVTLPSGCVIDMNVSKVPSNWTQKTSIPPAALNVYQQQGWAQFGPDPNIAGNSLVVPPMEVMFSPRGNIAGSITASGALFFVIRDLRDVTNNINPAATNPTPSPQGDALILAVFPQTGLVQTYDLDMTDNINNQTGQPGADGLADNVFNFAQRGFSAGK